MRHLNRITPRLPAEAFKTYGAAQPLATHFRVGTCEEAGCVAFQEGWLSLIDESTELGQRQAGYIRRTAGRRFTEVRTEAGLTEFSFEAGQQCFRTHHVPLERPAVYYVQDGDWRAPGQMRQHASGDDWVDDFATHQDKLASVLEHG